LLLATSGMIKLSPTMPRVYIRPTAS